MLKILQVRLQQYRNQEITDVQAGFRKGRGTRDQIANIHWIIEKSREFQINIYFCFIVEKEMATHSSILAWRIPGTEEPGGLQCTGSQRVRQDWVTDTHTQTHFVCKLNGRSDNIQPWHTPFPILNQSSVPCSVLTVASWPAYRFLRRQVRWSGISNS